ncbi:type VI secretion system Vgr family protein [Mixta intestinalis]|uniref:Actin cross-linking toxin VgrG1 n=1 Tax=Mixta intestinalis TaxID=1615494 RepID=A0A6P1PUG5_9GAMM|nr:type VI secretion system tip protein TssI/VgrG [Mixta intestinalis]QHM69933.1 Actin cross-linking toxin VgrG1 [Mixta intestinalis]
MIDRITIQLSVAGLRFWKLSGNEALSKPFSFTVSLLATDARIDRAGLLGQPLTVILPTRSLLPRYLNGKITRVAVNATELSGVRYAEYRLTLEPDIWPMQRDRNLRIFQKQNVPQIIKTLLSEYQVEVEDKLCGKYRDWEYCVQYQESSFNFISRLMELEGIGYHFRHERERHVMVLTDDASAYQPLTGYEVIRYLPTATGGSTDEDGISQWAPEDSVTPGLYSLDDYDFRKPHAWMFQARQNPSSPTPGSIDVYDWPGRFIEHSHAEFYAQIRQQRWQVEHHQTAATSPSRGIAPGHTFTLTHAPFFNDNGEYLITSAKYDFQENRYASGDEGSHCLTEFTVIPADVTWRPPQTTRWPRTYGPQTARVVGPKGESIWTDRYGRVKVQFHWDREAKGDETSSCWIRVSSAWAGQGFGGVQIPRVGDEVVIDFINGDPDRPIITGRVYNEASMPPWTLPAAATQMGFLSRTKDGTPANANALRFEDKAGSEQLWLQAERNMDTNVKQDETHTVGKNLTKTIGANITKSVGADETINVKKNRRTHIHINNDLAVKEDHSTVVGGKTDLWSQGSVVIASATSIRLVCNGAAIELDNAGNINMVCNNFNIYAQKEGQIATGNMLDLNMDGAKAGTGTAPEPGEISAKVAGEFPPKPDEPDESKKSNKADKPGNANKSTKPDK